MKQSIITLVLTLFAIGVFARPTTVTEVKDYVVTEDGVTYVDKVRTGWGSVITGVTAEGNKLRFNKSDVKAFRKKGKEFKRLYLVEKGSNFVKSIFLERLYTRAGYTMYKKAETPSHKVTLTDFYVYDGNQAELQLNHDNYKVVLSFFFPRFNEMFNS